jgi:hypothetical protein
VKRERTKASAGRCPHRDNQSKARAITELSIDPDYVRRLVVKVRAFMAKEGPAIPDDGSNPTDDALPSALQDEDGDLSRKEVIEEIRGFAPRQQGDLVALMWLGRGDGEPEEWDELVAAAIERRETPTENYLLDHPLVAAHWLDGMERLGLSGPPETARRASGRAGADAGPPLSSTYRLRPSPRTAGKAAGLGLGLTSRPRLRGSVSLPFRPGAVACRHRAPGFGAEAAAARRRRAPASPGEPVPVSPVLLA